MHPKRRVRKFNCKKCGEFEVVTGMYGGGDTGCGGCKCGNSKVFIN